jgi:6-phosphogluconolactonase (cycloisomerase 2 family)
MYRYCKHLALTIGLMVAATLGLSAQQYLYVMTGNSTNTVRAYSVSLAGTLVEISGSPFSTGGTGDPSGGLYAASRSTIVVANNLLFVANEGSNSVSAFTINPGTGALTAVVGSPFSTGETGTSDDMSLAATSQYLFAGDVNGDNVTVFSIGAGGALTEISGSPFSTGTGSDPNGMMVTPNGQYLIVGLSGTDRIAVFSIAGSGALSHVSGSPFAPSSSGGVTGIEIMSTSNLLFAPKSNFGQAIVDVFDIAANGSLSQISGSPFTTSDASNSNVALLSPDEQYLFVSNQASSEITVFSVAANGALTQISGSPFAVTGTGTVDPAIMATNYDGTLLYASTPSNGRVSVFSVAASGALTQVVGSPFNPATGLAPGLAAYPSLLPDQRLPVELSGFSLSASDNTVRLAWRTASETDNVGFEVQRADGQNATFRTIASYLNHPSLTGLGTSAIGQNYNFTDAELQPGEYLYRLIDVSTEGGRTVHPAKLIRVESNEQITTAGSMRLHPIVPNPVADELAISFALPQEQSVRVDIYTNDGKRISTPVSGRSYGAGNHTESVSVEGVPAGSYVVIMSAGIQTRTQRFVVVR